MRGRQIRILAVSLFLADAFSTNAQVLSVTTDPGYPVVRIDVGTGATQTLFTTGVTSAHAGLNAFDPSGHLLFFLTGFLGSQQLVTASLMTGSVAMTSIASTSRYIFFEYDPTTGRILAVTDATGFPVVSIDPATGNVQTLLPTDVTIAYEGLSAFDAVNRRLYFLTGSLGTQAIVTVDLNTNVVSSTAIPSPDAYVFFEYDPLTGRVLAVMTTPGYPVVSIDPATGNMQTLVTTGVTSAHPGLSVIDPPTRRLFFLTGTVGTQQLVTADIATGAVSSVSIARTPAAFVFFEGDFASHHAIPTLNETMLLLFAAGLAILGAWTMRRSTLF